MRCELCNKETKNAWLRYSDGRVMCWACIRRHCGRAVRHGWVRDWFHKVTLALPHGAARGEQGE